MASEEYNGKDIVVVSIVFLLLTWISVSLRCFVRVTITKSFRADDWFMIVSLINFTLSCIFILLGVCYGLGHHNDDLTQAARLEALKYQVLATTTYVSSMMFIKLAIAIFLLRLAVKKIYIWILKISIIVVALWSTAIFLYNIFQCRPVAAQWDFTITPRHCVSGDSFVAAAYSISVMSIISDWMYALMPIFMIWSIQMTVQKKVTVGFILSLGIFASIATLIRLGYLVQLADVSDILFTGTTAMVWTLVEPGVAITAASLITIRPLLRACKIRGFESSERSSPPYYTGSRSRRNGRRISLLTDIPVDSWGHTVSGVPFSLERNISENSRQGLTTTTREIDRAGGEGSQENIGGTAGILRTMDIVVTHDVKSLRREASIYV